MLPHHFLTDFNLRARTRFKKWLQACGSVIHRPTNPYEVMRFDAAQGVGLVYRNKKDSLTWNEPAADAWNHFAQGKTWRPVEKTPRTTKGARRRAVIVPFLMRRDGSQCLYCSTELTEETATIEHIVPLSHGGKDNVYNMALACEPCNHGLGDLPAARKIAVALAKRMPN